MDPAPSSHSQGRYSYNPTLRWNPQVEDYFNKAYGADHFARISEALTRPSRYTCVRVNTLKSTTDAIIQKLTAILHEKCHTTTTNSVNIARADSNFEAHGCIDQEGFTKGLSSFECDGERSIGDDHFSIDSSHEPLISKCQIPDMDYVLFVNGSGPHILDYGGATDQPLKEVIVSRKCAEAVLRGAQVFVPGVLACSAHVEKGDKVAISVSVEQPLSDNEWAAGITRGIVLQGITTDPLYDERRGLYIGQGNAILSRAGIFRASQGIAVELTDRVYRLLSFHDVLPGEIFLQNLPSIITAHVLDPQQGERILDMCAAPGGKTTAIAILMRDKGEIVAVDRSHNKVMDILNRAEEMGLTCIRAFRLNALKAVRRLSTAVDNTDDINLNNYSKTVGYSYSKSVGYSYKEVDANAVDSHINSNVSKMSSINKGDARSNTSRMKNGPGRNHGKGSRTETSKGFLPCTFDRVLLDAPCSALGLRPRLFAGEETLESLKNHAKYQKRMFDQAVQLVRPGGIIVYSTCTINPGENEALVRYVLDKYKFLSLAPQHPRIGGPGLIRQSEPHDAACIEKWLTPDESELVQRFDPSSSLDTIGFFIAKFIRSQEGTYH